MIARLMLVFAFSVATAMSSASAEKRIALLVGNSSYGAAVGALTNPHNDVKLVGDALKRVGFEVLSPVKDATRLDILVAVHDYAEKLKRAGPDAVGFFYYTGHGVAAGGENYIVPVDMPAISRRRMSLGGVRQTEISKILRSVAPKAVHYLVFDACRNNLGGARGAKGFVPVRQESGLLIAFATAPGDLASDLGSGGGPYAKALASEIIRPGVSDLLMFHRVRVKVSRATKGEQVPWTMDGIQRSERLMLGGVKKERVEPSKPRVSPLQKQAEIEYWSSVKGSNDPAAISLYLKQYPKGTFAPLARLLITRLKKQADAKVVASIKKEELRQTEERKDQAEAAHQTAQQALQEARLARKALAEAQLARNEALRAAEAARRSNEQFKRETDRLRQINVARLKTQETFSKSESKGLQQQSNFVSEVQSRLKQLGCYAGRVDGKWGRGSKAALSRALGERAGQGPSKEVLDLLKSVKAGKCAAYARLRAKQKAAPSKQSNSGSAGRQSKTRTSRRDRDAACRAWLKCVRGIGCRSCSEAMSLCPKPALCFHP